MRTAESTSFKEGVIFTTEHLAPKDLEFDEVIVLFVSARNYQTEVDKCILYIALHYLTLTDVILGENHPSGQANIDEHYLIDRVIADIMSLSK